MASKTLLNQLEDAMNDLRMVASSSNFNRIKQNPALMDQWAKARDLASLWYQRSQPAKSKLDDSTLLPLLTFATRIAAIGESQQVLDQNYSSAIIQATSNFQPSITMLVYEIFEFLRLFDFSQTTLDEWRGQALRDLDLAVTAVSGRFAHTVEESLATIRSSSEEASRDFEKAKEKANEITVDNAQKQFLAAAKEFKLKAYYWGSTTVIFSIALFGILIWLWRNPPLLLKDIMDAMRPGSKMTTFPVSVPLLIAASAYFTGIRLAIIGILGTGLAFSLRMTRAYLHMIEHNQHKLRVTNSIQAFVAAVRTSEQKDIVLSKLVESVTEFSDPGILSEQAKMQGLPSVFFESMTKNVSKGD